jgi:SAM-dependent methyltransferase
VQDQRSRFPIDDALLQRLEIVSGDVVLELGCGRGFTLAAAAERAADVILLGLDIDLCVLVDAQAMLHRSVGVGQVVAADLSCPLPLASSSVTKVLCHNVLEQLPDAAGVVAEASRVMRPGALAVWSHADFESVVISGGDPDLTRRIVRSYAALDAGGRVADPLMGRKLAGVVHRSPLRRLGVDTHGLLSTELRGPAELRVKSTFSVLCEASVAGRVDITVPELESWLAGLRAADRRGEFLYAHTTFIVVAEKP